MHAMFGGENDKMLIKPKENFLPFMKGSKKPPLQHVYNLNPFDG